MMSTAAFQIAHQQRRENPVRLTKTVVRAMTRIMLVKVALDHGVVKCV